LLLAGCKPPPDCRVLEGEAEDRRASAGCVVLRDGRMLVIEHSFSGKLGLPGGGRKRGETAQCTAHRETFEETALDVRVGRRLGLLYKGFTVYRCHAKPEWDGEPEPPLSTRLEIRDTHWRRPATLDAQNWRHPDELPPLLDMLDTSGKDDQ
jgi:8-oxo-dGTP pyrophosphatase MutT (NUDIX family)